MKRPHLVPLLLCWLTLVPQAASAQEARPAAGDIVFIAAANHTAPLSTFKNGVMVDGIIKDLGDALARRLGLRPRYLTMPSKRAPWALRDGEGDLLCYARPQWIGPDFQFTLPVIPNGEVVAARPDAPKLEGITQLAGQPVGTVLGYLYPEAEAVLGAQLRREDAPDMLANLRKLVAGRMPYAITDRLVLREHQRQNPKDGLREDLMLNRFTAPCALSPRSKIPLPLINEALSELVADGEMQRILARYGS